MQDMLDQYVSEHPVLEVDPAASRKGPHPLLSKVWEALDQVYQRGGGQRGGGGRRGEESERLKTRSECEMYSSR